MSVEDVRRKREACEERARQRAATLDAGGDYHAFDNFVCSYNHLYHRVDKEIECETHWDACLVLIALGEHRS